MLYLFREKQNTFSALLFGALFSGTNLAVRCLENSSGGDGKQAVFAAVEIVVFTLITGEIYLRLEALIKKAAKKNKSAAPVSAEKAGFVNSDRGYFLICLLVLWVAYLPVFLAYYPGLFAYDVDTQIPQLVEGYSKHHNLIHTLYLHFFYYLIGGELLHSYTAGIAWASIVQMTVFSMMISYIHLFLRRIKIDLKVRIVLIGLSAFLPFFSVLSVSMTKDVFFTGFAGMLAVCLYYWEKDAAHYQKTGNRIIYILSVTGTILFRNNGIYAVLLFACAGLFTLVLRKKNMRFLGCTATGIVLAFIISSGMSAALLASNGSQNEMLSIPYQQMAYVYNTKYESLTDEEREEIVELIPDVENYNPHLSDPIKANATGAYQKKTLLKCYLQLFAKYPVEYVQAFLLHNAGYFYIGDTSHASIYGVSLEERSGYLLTDTKAGFGVEHHSYFKALEGFYERLYSANEYQNVFLLKILCSPAIYLWMIVLLFFYGIDLRRFYPVQLAFVFGLVITVLAGPCVLIRYAFPYIICIPALAAAVLTEKNVSCRMEERKNG